MISLFPFQIEASTAIADRFRSFITDPERPSQRGYGLLPFYQSLHALTGSGKTPVLADAVTQMRTVFAVEPIVLWISKAKVVVDQTLTNFQDGGKYHHLVDRFVAMPLPECGLDHIEDAHAGLILLGTVGLFNSKEKGDRRIYEARPDTGELSLWDNLINRGAASGKRRPLTIVYDEGHNLTDQQANILLELHPEAFILASATPRLPPKLAEFVAILHSNQYTDDQLRTSIQSTAVVEAELVKREVDLGGYVTAEEEAISAMLADLNDLKKAASAHGLAFTPKCIYVCKTNIKDDEQKAFAARAAPPIRIWRYLVTHCGVTPSDIAVYCDLKVTAAHPLPKEFVLFKGGENDYSNFVAGNFKHIIFNQSLQEGWDDPECYLAYIDKSMGSDLQVEQVIGRVLRQPGAKYYPDPALNTSGFYIHLDDKGVFADILKRVKHKLAHDIPGIEVKSTGGSSRTVVSQPPRVSVKLPMVYVQMAAAADAVQEVLEQVGDYANSPDATTAGLVAQVTQEIGKKNNTGDVEWVKRGQGMPVTVQWLLSRFIERQYPAARAVCDMNDPRFSRLVHIGSVAAKQLESQATALVSTFLQHVSYLVPPGLGKEVGEAKCDDDKKTTFTNSVHPAYSNLNKAEESCAAEIDSLGWPWYRNPSNGGFALPLFQPGNKRSFYPDFIIWTDTAIWLVDPKGDHLIRDDAGRKLLAVDNVPGQLPLKVCLITDGTWDKNFNKLAADGVTAWRLKAGTTNNPEKYSSLEKLLAKVVGVKG